LGINLFVYCQIAISPSLGGENIAERLTDFVRPDLGGRNNSRTHMETHIRTEERRGLDRKLTHTRGAYIHIGIQKNTRIYTHAYTYTRTSERTETQ